MKNVVVWGTGNVGRPAIRAVATHTELNLVGAVVSNPEKIGVDAGELAGIEPLGVNAVDNIQTLMESTHIDCVIYTANADTRPEEAFTDLVTCLASGINVVSTAFYPLLYPAICPEEAFEPITAICDQGQSSVLTSGVDPGWAMDILPVLVTSAGSGIKEIRCREIFNYATYNQPEVVRNIVGFGQSMDETPMMLDPTALKMVWEPMIRLIGDALGLTIEKVETVVEREPLQKTVDVEGMGRFDEGTQGAFRFEVQGFVAGKPLIVMEHITRIDDDCGSQWAYPPEGQGCHQIKISGNPDIHLTMHADDHYDAGPAAGGNATAANRIVNLVPAVCDAKPGILSVNDVPMVSGRQQVLV